MAIVVLMTGATMVFVIALPIPVGALVFVPSMVLATVRAQRLSV